MLASHIENLIKQGEGLKLEFKESKTGLNKSLFETICAFLNRVGGEILLGVNDKGVITGIAADHVEKIKHDFATCLNNTQKINPSCYASLTEIVIEQKTILYVHIPESSQVHRCSGQIYDRNEDGDLNITDNTTLVSAMYLRKQQTYSENTVYPYAELVDLRADVLERVKKAAVFHKKDHPWGAMDDQTFLQSIQMYKRDYQTGRYGVTLAGILLFGKDNTILSVVPHFKTDAILRRDNIDRYDDRDDICTNLIESYDRLMQFGEKHLNYPFYLEKDIRISLRDAILREAVGNSLIHREYMNPFPAKFIIDREKLYTENSNKPHNIGVINPQQFTPYPKNPAVARVFREMGRADELGSGVRNLYRYCRAYCGEDPQLIEGDVFRFVLPLGTQVPYKYPASHHAS